MPSTRGKTVRGGSQKAKTTKSSGKIDSYLTGSQVTSPASNMADPRGLMQDSLGVGTPSTSLTVSNKPDLHTESLIVPRLGPGHTSQPLTLCMDADLRALLTKADIDALIGRLEEQHRKDFLEVRRDVQTLTSRLTTGENTVDVLQQRITTLESLQDTHTQAAVTLQLHME